MRSNYKASSYRKTSRSTLTGIVVNAFLAVTKGLGGYFGNSHALIADAIESAADVLSSSLLWWGLRWSSKPADIDHPYGHGKLEALIAVAIALILWAAAGVIVLESIHNIRAPHPPPKPYTLLILLAVVTIKEILYRFVLKTGSELGSGVVIADAFHHRMDAITSAAAFIGIGVSLVGGEGFEVADDWAAIVASGIILFNAYGILRRAVGELLDEEVEPELNEAIRRLASEVPGVVLVEKCHTRKMGVMKHADLHVWVNKNLTVEQGHDIAHRVKDRIQQSFPQFADVHIHIEPASSN